MNEIDAWLACDDDGTQWLIYGTPPQLIRGKYCTGHWGQVLCQTHGHAINPGECRQVRLKVEVVKDGS